ncbi:MAG: cyclic nucleotide-binding domain-containing protein [Deltaproteobacteria bacterium]|nr:cyclic nucleotide-binding domain-containing protein [Deltaproteobacteria bacterium]
MSKDQAAELGRLTALLDKNPQDLKARRSLADLYKEAKRDKHAIAEYQAVAGAYAAQGLLFRAISTCKIILALDPKHDETHQTLASLYARQDAQADATLGVTLPPSMAPALTVDVESVVESVDDDPATLMPPVPPEEVSEIFELEDAEVVDANTLAALTVRAEGSVQLARPAAVPLFCGLSQESFSLMVRELKAWEAEPGAVIIAEGEEGDSLFVIARGRVRVERQGKDGPVVVGHLGEAAFFGEIALMDRRERAASVIAETTTELLEISRATVDELVVLDPDVRLVLDAFCSERLKKSVLLSSPVFEGLSLDLHNAASAQFEERAVEAGVVVVEQGKPSGGLFVVLSGGVDVMARAEIGSLRLKQLAAGDVFGEMSLLSGAPASASVVTSSKTRLLVLPAEAFAAIATDPEMAVRMKALSEQRAAFNARFLPQTDGARSGAV